MTARRARGHRWTRRRPGAAGAWYARAGPRDGGAPQRLAAGSGASPLSSRAAAGGRAGLDRPDRSARAGCSRSVLARLPDGSNGPSRGSASSQEEHETVRSGRSHLLPAEHRSAGRARASGRRHRPPGRPLTRRPRIALLPNVQVRRATASMPCPSSSWAAPRAGRSPIARDRSGSTPRASTSRSRAPPTGRPVRARLGGGPLPAGGRHHLDGPTDMTASAPSGVWELRRIGDAEGDQLGGRTRPAEAVHAGDGEGPPRCPRRPPLRGSAGASARRRRQPRLSLRLVQRARCEEVLASLRAASAHGRACEGRGQPGRSSGWTLPPSSWLRRSSEKYAHDRAAAEDRTGAWAPNETPERTTAAAEAAGRRAGPSR